MPRCPGRPVSPLARRLRALPNPRLTGLGSGLFCAGSMFLLGCLDQLLFGGSIAVYGVLFLLVSALTAIWVRRADLITAPICAPIAFTAGVVPIADSTGDGLAGRIMGVFTALALHAGWLYGGTLVAGLIVLVRKVRLIARKAAANRAARSAQRARVRAEQRAAGAERPRRPHPEDTPARALTPRARRAQQPEPQRPRRRTV
ncbi:DUF6542 domain-containing protein [Streptomyces uncialis]|uniref:DUF6542 domain-containing protein n=1 Tax=Streptomyces uncialis TaxID=1048205 RepID=UPI00379B764B